MLVFAIPAILGIGAVAAMLLAGLGGPSQKAVATMLFGLWATANCLWYMNLLWLLPVYDLGVGVVAFNFWLGGAAHWSLSVAFLSWLRLTMHVINWITAQAFFVGYAHVLNALFALQIVIIASTGGANGRRRFLSWLRRLRSVGGLGPARAQGLSRVR